jgi:hypothetical protein
MFRHIQALWELVKILATDSYFPLTVLGVLAAAFFFAFVLDADAQIVAGVLVVGLVTAAWESKARTGRH